jgi:hypothetical protein
LFSSAAGHPNRICNGWFSRLTLCNFHTRKSTADDRRATDSHDECRPLTGHLAVRRRSHAAANKDTDHEDE